MNKVMSNNKGLIGKTIFLVVLLVTNIRTVPGQHPIASNRLGRHHLGEWQGRYHGR